MKKTKNNKNIRILISAAVLLLIVFTAGFIVNKITWFFTPVYTQKNVADNFIKDIANGKSTIAYTNTTNAYKINTSYAQFYVQAQKLQNDKISIKNVSYVISKNRDTITGTINDMTVGKNLVFYINVAKSNGTYGVDAVIINPLG